MPVESRLKNLAPALAILAGFAAAPGCGSVPVSAGLPNILLILADDLGYGDVSAYNDQAKVRTSHLDAFAGQGMRFTDAHSPSTVCTPTRYGILTGRMPFRNGMAGVFTGVEGPCLIEEGRLTLPQMLHEAGYATAMVGKWHLGMTFSDSEGRPVHEIEFPAETRENRSEAGVERVRRVDFTRPVPDGPVDRGFGRFFGTVACPTTDWLYAWIDGDRVPVPPESPLDRTQLPKHPYANDNRRGMIAPDYDLETVDLAFLERSIAFLEEHAEESPDSPFFLFHSMQAVHLPSFAAPEFQGASEAGPHGDFLLEMDAIVGELLAALDRLQLADDTLVIFTSDNGPEVTSTYHMRGDYGHDGARPWRGVKRDQWEGGHRVPTIVRWPRRIPRGSVTDQTFNLTDIMATIASLTGYSLPPDAAEDSFDFAPLLLGTHDGTPIRDFTLHQTNRLALAIRQGRWKYLDHTGSGGNDYSRSQLALFAIDDGAPSAPGQLFDLEADPGETRNLYYEQAEVVSRLKFELDRLVEAGRSAPAR